MHNTTKKPKKMDALVAPHNQELLFNTSDYQDKKLKLGKNVTGTTMSLYSAGNNDPTNSQRLVIPGAEGNSLDRRFTEQRGKAPVPDGIHRVPGYPGFDDIQEPLTPSQKYVSYMSDTNEKEPARNRETQKFVISPQGLSENKLKVNNSVIKAEDQKSSDE